MSRSAIKIVVPVDLSLESRQAIEVASDLAKCYSGKLVFCYVSLPPLPQQAAYAQAELDAIVRGERVKFEEIVPSVADVACEHHMLQGNPGPEIVSFAKQIDADMIFIATHGRTGLLRFLMGSVAEYIVRNAPCEVLTLKSPVETAPKKQVDQISSKTNQSEDPAISPKPGPVETKYVTAIMQHSHEVHAHDQMQQVAADLQRTGEQCVPVVDYELNCIGVLSQADVSKYQQTCERLAERDPTVLSEVYPKNEFGLLRCDSDEFHRVKKHMSSPVVTVNDTDNYQVAIQLFRQHKDIHHLVVLNADHHPVGMVNAQDLIGEVDPTPTDHELETAR